MIFSKETGVHTICCLSQDIQYILLNHCYTYTNNPVQLYLYIYTVYIVQLSCAITFILCNYPVQVLLVPCAR